MHSVLLAHWLRQTVAHLLSLTTLSMSWHPNLLMPWWLLTLGCPLLGYGFKQPLKPFQDLLRIAEWDCLRLFNIPLVLLSISLPMIIAMILASPSPLQLSFTSYMLTQLLLSCAHLRHYWPLAQPYTQSNTSALKSIRCSPIWAKALAL